VQPLKAGTAAFQWYDPYDERLRAQMKRLMANGVPILLRLYPGVEYPMSEDDLHGIVDREGHVVLGIGYDEETNELLALDPWDASTFGGNRGAIRRLDWRLSGIEFVDCCVDFTMVALPWETKLAVVRDYDGRHIARGEVTYRCPPPLDPGQTYVDPLVVRLDAPEGVAVTGSPARDLGAFRPGETRVVEWPIEVTAAAEGELTFRAMGIVSGTDPYDYHDIMGEQATGPVPATTTVTVDEDSAAVSAVVPA
jgi:hypothetical protein